MDEADLLRILISTDNHLGVWEKDELRKDDSFRALEEVFEIAHQQNVDMVLLGGDLFHDNKPSRRTVVRAMEIFSKYCLGDRPVALQVLSDRAGAFAAGRANFESPHHNVGLPVFTIHGNHDDPAGAENLSAVDILSAASLVNYFGRVPITAAGGHGPGEVHLRPVVLRKGATRLALYGLGNLRDERLCRLFQTPGCVKWARPASTPDFPQGDYFSVFALHQNRVPHAQAARNVLRESHLAKFLDVVVWGHEHESAPDFAEFTVAGEQLYVTQPGSTVATALSAGEARRKHCVVLEVLGTRWRAVSHPLHSVRPFAFDTLALAGQAGLAPDDPDGLAAFLEAKVADMAERAARAAGPRAPRPPLVRLRVDYTGFSTVNTQRLGQKFVGRVANPNDIILWQKKAAVRRAGGRDGEPADGQGAVADPAGLVRPEALDEARIEDLVAEHLQHTLQILPEQELADALHEFVDKDNRGAIGEAVGRALQETQAAAARDGGDAGGAAGGEPAKEVEALDGIIGTAAERRRATVIAASAAARASQPPTANGGGAGPSGSRPPAAAAAAARPPRPPARGRAAPAPAPARRPPARAAAAAGGRRAARAASAEADSDDLGAGSGSDVALSDIMGSSSEEEGSGGEGRGGGAGRRGMEVDEEDLDLVAEAAAAPPSTAQRKRGRGAAAATQPVSQTASRQPRGGRGAAGAGASAPDVDLVSSDDDAGGAAPPAAARRRFGTAGTTGRSEAPGATQQQPTQAVSQRGWGSMK